MNALGSDDMGSINVVEKVEMGEERKKNKKMGHMGRPWFEHSKFVLH